MKKLLFICQANVGRSQMAEGFYNFFTHTKNATSAGVEDFAAKYHHRLTFDIIQVMAEVGIDISHQRIKILSKEMAVDADHIIILCAPSLCPDFILLNPKTKLREVSDPFSKDLDSVRQIRDQIMNIVKELL